MKTLILLLLSSILFVSCSNDTCKVKTEGNISVNASFNELDADLYNVGDSVVIRHTNDGVIVTDHTETFMILDQEEIAIITKMQK